MEQLVVIVLVIVSFMLIAGLIIRSMSNTDDKKDENLCKDSIVVRAATSVHVDAGPEVDLKLAPYLCKTIDKKVSGDREEIKQQLANSMARCWWMFGEGRYEEIFDTLKVSDKSENKCFVCSTALINEDSFEPISTQEFYRYLSNTKYPMVKDETYLEYIQQHGGPGAVHLLENIEPRKAYGISFLSKNKEVEATAGGAATKIGGGLAFGGTVIAVAAATACTATVVCAVIAGTGVIIGGVFVGAGAADVKHVFFDSAERSVSTVTLSSLDTAQQNCLRDLSGE